MRQAGAYLCQAQAQVLEKHFVGLFYVSVDVEHFKAIQIFRKKKHEIVWSGGKALNNNDDNIENY